jgi:uncharacterized membrane protein YphA (DoxX/SURF4 family)
MKSVSKDMSDRKTVVLLWIIQALLALLFLFAGVMKLIMPAEALAKGTSLPVLFLRFIGLAEVLGALGLILPGLFRIQRGLTPLAAAGLVIIMIGATVVNLSGHQMVAAVITLVTGLLSAFVAYSHWSSAPDRGTSRASAL